MKMPSSSAKKMERTVGGGNWSKVSGGTLRRQRNGNTRTLCPYVIAEHVCPKPCSLLCCSKSLHSLLSHFPPDAEPAPVQTEEHQ